MAEDDAPLRPKGKKRRRVVAPRLDDYVQRALAARRSYTEVLDLAVAEFEVDESTVKRSIVRVKAAWRAAAGEAFEEVRARFLAELVEDQRAAREADDHRAVAMNNRVLASVLGVIVPKKVEVSGTLGLRPVAAMSPQEREQELRMLLAKRESALGAGTAPVTDKEPATKTPAKRQRVH